MKILMIIPAYNEAENVRNTIDNIKKYDKLNVDWDVLLKNKINFIDLSNNLGIGGAVQTGYKYAYYNDYDIAVQFDGDGQNDIEMLEAVGTGVAMGNAKDEVKEKADVVCKSVEEDGVYYYCLENKLITEIDELWIWSLIYFLGIICATSWTNRNTSSGAFRLYNSP